MHMLEVKTLLRTENMHIAQNLAKCNSDSKTKYEGPDISILARPFLKAESNLKT